jgi:ABC-type transport system involved in multi-copper enzyme maturation permease subunit
MSTTTQTTPTLAAPAATVARGRRRDVPEPIPTSRIAAVELRKMFDTRAGFWLMASIVILSVIATTATIIFAPDDELTYEAFAAAVGFPMAVVLPIIAVLSVTSEWSQRSALTTFTLVPSRGRVIAVKAFLAVAIGVVSMLVAAAVGAVGNVIGSNLAGVDVTWNVSMADFSLIVLANVLGMLAGFMLGVVFRSSPAAIVGYFVFSFVLTGVAEALSAVNEWFADNAPWLDFNTATGRLFDGADGLTAEAWAQVGVTTLAWVALPLFVGMRFLLRSEIK